MFSTSKSCEWQCAALGLCATELAWATINLRFANTALCMGSHRNEIVFELYIYGCGLWNIISLSLIGRHGWWVLVGKECSGCLASWMEVMNHNSTYSCTSAWRRKTKCFIRLFYLNFFFVYASVAGWAGGHQRWDRSKCAAITLLLIYVLVVYLIWFQCECSRGWYCLQIRVHEQHRFIWMGCRCRFVLLYSASGDTSNWKGFCVHFNKLYAGPMITVL